jgi:putative flavoprotein involved in K+ transport
MSEHYAVAIIGAGQAGLSMSYLLTSRGIEHVVLEKERVAHAWRTDRWDSFCLVTPNWQCTLPNFPYRGNDPDGFMKKDEIVAYIEAFAASFSPPLREGVAVSRLGRGDDGRSFALETSEGRITAGQVVVAIGGYHATTLPRMAERVPRDILHVHSSAYKSAQALPEGAVLVVGTGQSGAQIAEDLHLGGRLVHLAVGSAPRTARRYRGRDVVAWLDTIGYYKMPVHEHPLKERVRAKANHYVTGRDGGRDIDLRKFAREGMSLYGRLLDVDGAHLHFQDDLKVNLDTADAVSESIKTTIDTYIEKTGIDAPLETRYVPVWEPSTHLPTVDMRAANITSIIWCMGYRADYAWIDVPIFDGRGYPSHERGVTTEPGLFFLGLPWQYTWGSGRFSGVARDAEYLAEAIDARDATTHRRDRSIFNEIVFGS